MKTYLIAALLLAAAVVPAQSQTQTNHGNEELRFTLILSRHGIRPPLVAASSLDRYSADPWPQWEVPLGYLTPHGSVALRQMGAYLRKEYAHEGLLPAKGCLSSGAIYIYSDTDERNIMSSYATLAGLEPGCAPRAVNTIVPQPGERDPLFSLVPPFKAPSPLELNVDRQDAMGRDWRNFYTVAGNPELKEFAHVLAPDPAHPAAQPLLLQPRPLAVASGMVEDVLLEFLDDKPMSQVGWGRVDEAMLRRLMPLHTKEFTLSTRTPLVARVEGSNMMAHILDTLEQAARPDGKPVAGALGPVGARMVYISGHDSNLCHIGGLLGVNWTAEGLTDDTPPDSEIVFELWQNKKTMQSTVKMLYRAQTINQLRSAAVLTLAHPPIEVPLTPPGCSEGKPCSFISFDYAAHTRINPAYVKADLLPTHVAQPVP
jgi:4-phytase / acid phosphatase